MQSPSQDLVPIDLCIIKAKMAARRQWPIVSYLVGFHEVHDSVNVSVDHDVVRHFGFHLIEPVQQGLQGILELTAVEEGLFQFALPVDDRGNIL